MMVNMMMTTMNMMMIKLMTTTMMMMNCREWQLRCLCDLPKIVPLNGGCAYIGVSAQSQIMSEHESHLTSTASSSTDTAAAIARQHTLASRLLRLRVECRDVLSTYPVASSFASVRYPETFVKLSEQVAQYRAWLSLQLDFRFPAVFHTIIDESCTAAYSRVFSLLMKVSPVVLLIAVESDEYLVMCGSGSSSGAWSREAMDDEFFAHN